MKNSITFKGKIYNSLTEIIKDQSVNIYNISLKTASARLNSGWTLEETFSIPLKASRDTVINYKGKCYRSLKELSNDKSVNIYNLNYVTIQQRMNLGWTLEQAITTPLQEPGKQIIVFGRKFNSLMEVISDKTINKYNIPYETLRTRLKIGWTIEKALSEPSQENNTPVTYKGKTFKSLTELVEDKTVNVHNIKLATLTYRLKNGMTLEEAIETPVKDTTIVYKGKTYKNLKELVEDNTANIHSLTYKLIAERLKDGWSLDRALLEPRRTQYSSKKLSKELNKFKGESQYIDKHIQHIIINGKVYNSIYEVAEDKKVNIHNLGVSTIKSRLNKGFTIEQSLLTPRLSENVYIVNGKVYTSLLQVVNDKTSNIYGLSYNTIHSRIKSGWSITDALNTPLLR